MKKSGKISKRIKRQISSVKEKITQIINTEPIVPFLLKKVFLRYLRRKDTNNMLAGIGF